MVNGVRKNITKIYCARQQRSIAAALMGSFYHCYFSTDRVISFVVAAILCCGSQKEAKGAIKLMWQFIETIKLHTRPVRFVRLVLAERVIIPCNFNKVNYQNIVKSFCKSVFTIRTLLQTFRAKKRLYLTVRLVLNLKI